MGGLAVCLDQSQNIVSCLDPECTYGDCGSSAASVQSGSVCLDQNQNPVNCGDPECTYGDCQSNPNSAIGLAAVAHDGGGGGVSLTTPSAGGATGGSLNLVNAISNAITAGSKVFTAPPKTTFSLGSSGLNVSSAGSLFSNPLMLIMLAVIAMLVYGVWKKR